MNRSPGWISRLEITSSADGWKMLTASAICSLACILRKSRWRLPKSFSSLRERFGPCRLPHPGPRSDCCCKSLRPFRYESDLSNASKTGDPRQGLGLSGVSPSSLCGLGTIPCADRRRSDPGLFNTYPGDLAVRLGVLYLLGQLRCGKAWLNAATEPSAWVVEKPGRQRLRVLFRDIRDSKPPERCTVFFRSFSQHFHRKAAGCPVG